MARANVARKPTLSSGLALIEHLLASRGGMSLTDLAHAIDMDLGQTHRLLAVLAELRYIYRDDDSGNYRLTAKLVTLAGRYLATSDLVDVSRPFMHDLWKATGETVHLAARSGDFEAVCVARELSPQPVATTSDVGQTFSDETSAIGRAVARAAPGHETRSVPSFASSVDREQHRAGVTAVASPIVDWRREVVGAIAVSGPSFRLDSARVEELGSLVAKTAIAISEAIGYSTTGVEEVIRT